ncbi:HIT family protein [Candidatus Woesearchaeota archaeon]|nr:HIT family protein [Candidatus Woesearchaeota archaeon]
MAKTPSSNLGTSIGGNMEDCIFCKIIKGDIPCTKIYESENFFAFLDISPVSEGHTLLIPKQHCTNLLDVPEHLGTELLEVGQKIGRAILQATGADGFNFILNNGKAAGQAVFHAHFHIVPRKMGDGLVDWHHGTKVEDSELAGVREKILEKLL